VAITLGDWKVRVMPDMMGGAAASFAGAVHSLTVAAERQE
jgi:hypothetical protein